MAGKIPDDTLQAIRERVSIVEVVSGYVGLKKAGRNHIGLCPFAKQNVEDRLRILETSFAKLIGFMLGSGALGGATGALLSHLLK